jgi:hypothetical protein
MNEWKLITKNKTTSLVKLAHNSNKVIVCQSRMEADRISRYAGENGYNIKKPITYDELIYTKHKRINQDIEYMIDNIEYMIDYITDSKCRIITSSVFCESEEENDD